MVRALAPAPSSSTVAMMAQASGQSCVQMSRLRVDGPDTPPPCASFRGYAEGEARLHFRRRGSGTGAVTVVKRR
jgi:hypothetical protein